MRKNIYLLVLLLPWCINKVSAQEVMETGARVAEVFKELLRRIIGRLD